ncbi:MAG TPA: hypothetical protein VFD78_07205 [Chitinophagaceae bacterium]|nr:hypothetical protein [Chitinophagaceae bacterium]
MKDLGKALFLIIGLGLASCSPVYYKPNTHNVPLISQKGETNLTVSGNPDLVEFQGAYGVLENFAVKADGAMFISRYTSNKDGGSGKLLEIGATYFMPFKYGFVFDTYGIFGFGSMENHFPSTREPDLPNKGDITANFLRIGLQPSFGFKSKYFSAAFSIRIVRLSYHNIQGDLVFDHVNQIDYLKSNSSNILIEPALTLRGGLEKIKFQVQVGHSQNASNPNFKQETSFLTFGLNFNFL